MSRQFSARQRVDLQYEFVVATSPTCVNQTHITDFYEKPRVPRDPVLNLLDFGVSIGRAPHEQNPPLCPQVFEALL